jgi:hypothetical protein
MGINKISDVVNGLTTRAEPHKFGWGHQGAFGMPIGPLLLRHEVHGGIGGPSVVGAAVRAGGYQVPTNACQGAAPRIRPTLMTTTLFQNGFAGLLNFFLKGFRLKHLNLVPVLQNIHEQLAQIAIRKA